MASELDSEPNSSAAGNSAVLKLQKNGFLLALLVIVLAAVLIPANNKEVFYLLQDTLPLFMFGALAVLIFSGIPVAFILGGLAIIFGLIGMALDVFKPVEFFNFLPRIWGGAAENLVLTAIPAFVFMGVMMERSGIARDLLLCVQILIRRVPGVLALAVVIMGAVLAAMTGIIGASVTMITALALPTMMRQGYSHALATGAIAASGTLGILIPPSIMLIIMADLLAISVGDIFTAAITPGLGLAALYLIYIFVLASVKPSLAPPLALEALPTEHAVNRLRLFMRSLLPPVVLIILIKGSILFGWATPSEAGAIGAVGAIGLATLLGRSGIGRLREVCHASARTIAMIFMIIVCATCFAYVFRSLGGDDLIEDLIIDARLSSWDLLFLLMGITFVLGFLLDWIEITLIVLPVFAPMITGMDFGDHVAQSQILVWFAVLMALNLQTSFLTPPFGFALFYLKGVAPKQVNIRSIYVGIIPFVVLQIIALTLVISFPELSLWLVAFD